MKTTSHRISVVLAIGLTVCLAGCAGRPLLPNWASNGLPLPFDAIVIGPGERVSLDVLPTRRSNYFCSDGAVLQCERFSVKKLYCRCP